MKNITLKVLLFVWLGLLSVEVFCQSNPHKAPLYWSVYEHNWIKEQNHTDPNYIPESVFLDNIDMVDNQLKEFGYDMVCIDGWGDDSQYNEHGYRSTHSSSWEHDYAWWASHLQGRGLNLGMYNNPLWINRGAAESGAIIKGTDIPLSSLIDYNEEALWFTWVQVDRPGAEEYVKGYVQYYADMGIKYLRVDFLSWFEDGYDKNIGQVGPARPRAQYEKALRWMKEACDANGMLLSLVMPHLKNDAELEKQYGHMIRINEDVWNGGWDRFNSEERGIHRTYWSQWHNPFDGYTYWSKVSGRNQLILDGDFIRLNTMANFEEKKTVISLHLMAGGPLSPTDQAGSSMTAENLSLYTNPEMLALNHDGFVGKPLFSNDPANESSQVWAGQMSDGAWIVGFFNRENNIRNRSLDFSWLGIDGNATVRDLWAHQDLGVMGKYGVDVPPHGCVILKIEPVEGIISGQGYIIKSRYNGKVLDVSENSTSNGGLVHQWDYFGNDNQKWIVNEVGDGEFNIISQHSGKGLDVAGNSTDNGAAIHQWEYFGNNNQKWRIEEVEDGYYRILSVHSNKAIDIEEQSNENGAKIHQWSYFGGESQQWIFELVDDSHTLNGNSNKASFKQKKESERVLIYPNPAGNELNFKMEETSLKIQILNNYGLSILDKKPDEKNFSIDTSLLEEGMYFIKIIQKDESPTIHKILIER